MTCPYCKAPDMRRSHRRWWERPLAFFQLRPYRCKQCDRRCLRYSLEHR